MTLSRRHYAEYSNALNCIVDKGFHEQSRSDPSSGTANLLSDTNNFSVDVIFVWSENISHYLA